jgi:hypothetical protein
MRREGKLLIDDLRVEATALKETVSHCDGDLLAA